MRRFLRPTLRRPAPRRLPAMNQSSRKWNARFLAVAARFAFGAQYHTAAVLSGQNKTANRPDFSEFSEQSKPCA
jgi:hypothetical protein